MNLRAVSTMLMQTIRRVWHSVVCSPVYTVNYRQQASRQARLRRYLPLHRVVPACAAGLATGVSVREAS